MKKLLKSKSGFTLVEMVVVVFILGVLSAVIIFAAIHGAKTDSTDAASKATVKTLTDAFNRVKLMAGTVPGVDDINPGTVAVTAGADPSADAQAAAQFYYQWGLIQKMPPLDHVTFLGGEWLVSH